MSAAVYIKSNTWRGELAEHMMPHQDGITPIL